MIVENNTHAALLIAKLLRGGILKFPAKRDELWRLIGEFSSPRYNWEPEGPWDMELRPPGVAVYTLDCNVLGNIRIYGALRVKSDGWYLSTERDAAIRATRRSTQNLPTEEE